MAVLNITYNGMSVDYPFDVDYRMSDNDVRRIALELIRSGDVPGLDISNLADNAFNYFVVDRFNTPEGGERIFLRPKVPFGASFGN